MSKATTTNIIKTKNIEWKIKYVTLRFAHKWNPTAPGYQKGKIQTPSETDHIHHSMRQRTSPVLIECDNTLIWKLDIEKIINHVMLCGATSQTYFVLFDHHKEISHESLFHAHDIETMCLGKKLCGLQ